MIGWLFDVSFQNSGAAICCSIFSSRVCLAAESKIPPYTLDAGTQAAKIAIEFV